MKENKKWKACQDEDDRSESTANLKATQKILAILRKTNKKSEEVFIPYILDYYSSLSMLRSKSAENSCKARVEHIGKLFWSFSRQIRMLSELVTTASDSFTIHRTRKSDSLNKILWLGSCSLTDSVIRTGLVTVAPY